MATSGLPGWQYHGSWLRPRGGIIPPGSWTLSTLRLRLDHVKGVEGSFYGIAPFSKIVDGVVRGDFGVHFDANIVGSLGCPVIKQQDHWDEWRRIMKLYHDMRIKAVPFEVIYT